MFILSSLMFGIEIKVNNISTILPNKIDVNNFSKALNVNKNEEGSLTLKENSKLTYNLKVKKSGVYKIMLNVTGEKNSSLSIGESIVPEYKAKYVFKSSINEPELVEIVTYF